MHMHIHNHTHLLDNLIILCQLIIVLPHQQHNESGFAPKERVKEGEKEGGRKGGRKGGRGGRERERGGSEEGESTINKKPLQR